jgi:hypothetical protein
MALDPEEIAEAAKALASIKQGLIEVSQLTQQQTESFRELLRVMSMEYKGAMDTFIAAQKSQLEALRQAGSNDQEKIQNLQNQASLYTKIQKILKDQNLSNKDSLKLLSAIAKVQNKNKPKGKGDSVFGKRINPEAPREVFYRRGKGPKPKTPKPKKPGRRRGRRDRDGDRDSPFADMVYSTGADFVKDVLGQKLFTVASSMAQYAGAFANTLGDAFVGIDDQYRSFVKSTGMHAGILEDVYTNIMSPIEPAMYGLEQTAAGAKQLRQMFANLGGISEQTGITTEESAEAMGELMSTVRMMRRSVMEASPEMRVFGVAASRLTADLKKLGVEQSNVSFVLNEFNKAQGLTGKALLDQVRHIAGTAEALDLNLKTAFSDFVNMYPKIAMFGGDVQKVFKGLQATAVATGADVGKLTDVAMSMDTFEGAAKAAGRLNAVLGGMNVSVMDLVHASPEDKIRLLQEAVDKSGKSFATMDRRQQQVIATAAGMDIAMAQKVFGGIGDEAAGVGKVLAEQKKLEKRANDLGPMDTSAIEQRVKDGMTMMDKVNQLVFRNALNIKRTSEALVGEVLPKLADLGAVLPEKMMEAIAPLQDTDNRKRSLNRQVMSEYEAQLRIRGMRPPAGAVRLPKPGTRSAKTAAPVSGRAARANAAAQAAAEQARKIIEAANATGKVLKGLDSLKPQKQTGASPFDLLDTLPATLKKAEEPAAALSKTLGDGGNKLLTSVVAAQRHLEAMHTKLQASALLSPGDPEGNFVKSFKSLDVKGKTAMAKATGVSVEDLEKLVKAITAAKEPGGDTRYLTASDLKNITLVLKIGKSQFKTTVEKVINGDL